MKVKITQSCPTLCNPVDGNPPGSPVPGILQARTPQWVAISFSNTWKWKVKVKSLSRVRLFATPWTAAHQAPPPMGISMQEFWSRLPLSSLPLLWGCCNKIPQARWLKTTEMYSLTVLDVRCLKSRCQQGMRQWLPTPVFLLEKPHGQRSLMDYSPLGHRESDTIEQLTLSLFVCEALGIRTAEHLLG